VPVSIARVREGSCSEDCVCISTIYQEMSKYSIMNGVVINCNIIIGLSEWEGPNISTVKRVT
jgi:hypothetical protein